MPLIADRKERVYEGVKLHCGPLFAVQAHMTFENKYTAKHGSCLDYVVAFSQDTNAHMDYARRETKVYERYMMMRVHEYDKQFKPMPQVFAYEGGLRE